MPMAGAATVDAPKLRDYLLNKAHSRNGGKAAFFQSFGFDKARPEQLRDALVLHAKIHHVADLVRSSHGMKYVLRCSLPTPDGRDPCVATVWIIEPSQAPRLVTAHPSLQVSRDPTTVHG